MPLTASGDVTAAVGSNYQRAAIDFSIDLPGLPSLDLTPNLGTLQADGQNTTSYPTELTDQSGESDWGGTLTLHPRDDDPYPLLVLLNPDDPSSPLYRRDYTDSPMAVSIGLYPPDADPDVDPPSMVDYLAFVNEVDYDRAAGEITIAFNNVPRSFQSLPGGLAAVLTPPPWNAGLTNEYVIDRTARAASGGLYSSWPVPRPGCVLAVGFRASLWPEVGYFTPQTAWSPKPPSFVPMWYGSALAAPGLGTILPYTLAAPLVANITTEIVVSGTAGQLLLDLQDVAVGVAPNIAQVTFDYDTNTVAVQIVSTGGVTDTFTVPGLTDGQHYVGVHIAWNAGSWSATVRIDGVTTASGTRTVTGLVRPGGLNYAMLTYHGAATVAAWQVSNESNPAWNDAFTPRLICDPSCNPLEAVPGIDKGSSAWEELQTIAESEGGWIGFRGNPLTLYFLNRDSILNAAPAAHYTTDTALVSQATATGQAAPYDDVALDFTGWTFSTPKLVFTPTAIWKLPAHRTTVFERTLLSGTTASIVDGSIAYLPAGHGMNDGNSWARYSLDRFGNGEFPAEQIDATVEAIGPSRLRFTFVNHSHRHDAFTAAPATQVDIAAGTPSVWIGGRLAGADDPTTLHANPTGPWTNPYSASNPYWQDQDTVLAFARLLWKQLRTPLPAYSNVVIKPDPTRTVPDKVTLDILTAAAGVQPTNVLCFGVGIDADFEQRTWEMPLDVRALVPPGAWRLGVHGASELGLRDGSRQGTAYVYPQEAAS